MGNVNGHHVGKSPVIWDLPVSPELLMDDIKWLSSHFCQLHQYPQMNLICPYGLVTLSGVAITNSFLLNCGDFILLRNSVFQLRELSTPKITVLAVEVRNKEGIEYLTFSSLWQCSLLQPVKGGDSPWLSLMYL